MMRLELVCLLIIFLGHCGELVSCRTVVHSSRSIVDHIKIFYLRSDLYVSFNNHLKKFQLPPVANASELETTLVEQVTLNLVRNCVPTSSANSGNLTWQVRASNELCYSHVASLDMSNNMLTHYPANITSSWFPKLKSLTLSNNLIANLSSFHHFSTAVSRHTLEELDLSFNQLTHLDEELFKHLPSLRLLHLSNNQIKTVNLFTFSTNAHNLIQLDLSHNLIADMEFLLFSSLVNLKQLVLDSNYIQTMPGHLLFNLYALEQLHLSSNSLKMFNLYSTRHNQKLRLVDLSLNNDLRFIDDDDEDQESDITETDKLIQPAENGTSSSSLNIEVLNLHGTDLSSTMSGGGRAFNYKNKFMYKLFKNCARLKHLNMSSTRLKHVWSINWPTSLEVIDLSRNQIQEFDCRQLSVRNMSNLNTIDLSFNHIRNFKQMVTNCAEFFKSTQLRNISLTVDLSRNMIESPELLNNTSLLSCESRINLKLSDNPLVCDCESNTWWTGVVSTEAKFHINKEFCFNLIDFNELSCLSISSRNIQTLFHTTRKIDTSLWSVQHFHPINKDYISSNLVCPYRTACSSQTCDCCGFASCDCTFNCPLACKCARDYKNTFDLVNCTGVNLTQVPLYLPSGTTKVLLDQNRLKRVQPYQFFGRHRVSTLNLAYNQITFIDEHAFYGLIELRTLRLTGNMLQILLGYEFNGLTQLETLHLDYNRIQFISNSTFYSLTKLTYLNLLGNNLLHQLDFATYFSKHLNPNSLRIVLSQPPEKSSRIDWRAMTSSLPIKTDQVLSRSGSGELPSQKYNNSFVLDLIGPSSPDLLDCIYNRLRAYIINQLNQTTQLTSLVADPFTLFSKTEIKSFYTQNEAEFYDYCQRQHEQQELLIKRMLEKDLLPKSLNYLSLRESQRDLYKESRELIDQNHHMISTQSPNSSFIILNLNVIVWGVIVLVMIIALFVFLVAVLVNKLKRMRNVYYRSSNKSEITTTSSNQESSSSVACISDEAASSHSVCSRSLRSARRHHRSFSNIKRRSFPIISTKKKKSSLIGLLRNMLSKTCSRFAGQRQQNNKFIRSNSSLRSSRYSSSQNKVDHLVFANYNMKKKSMETSTSISSINSTTVSSSVMIAGNTTSSPRSNTMPQVANRTTAHHDLLIVYNLCDTDLVKKVIGPVFNSTPFDLSVVFLHDLTSAVIDDHHSIQTMVHNSTFVIFIFTKSFFANDKEYNLLTQVPLSKRLGVLVDPSNEILVHDLVEPNRMLKCPLNTINNNNSSTLQYSINDASSLVSGCQYLFNSSFDKTFNSLNEHQDLDRASSFINRKHFV